MVGAYLYAELRETCKNTGTRGPKNESDCTCSLGEFKTVCNRKLKQEEYEWGNEWKKIVMAITFDFDLLLFF